MYGSLQTWSQAKSHISGILVSSSIKTLERGLWSWAQFLRLHCSRLSLKTQFYIASSTLERPQNFIFLPKGFLWKTGNRFRSVGLMKWFTAQYLFKTAATSTNIATPFLGACFQNSVIAPHNWQNQTTVKGTVTWQTQKLNTLWPL